MKGSRPILPFWLLLPLATALGSLCVGSAWLAWKTSQLSPQVATLPPVVNQGKPTKRLSRKLVLVLISGLTNTGARRMKQLQKLRKRGALLQVQTELPSHKLTGMVTLATGAPRSITGASLDRGFPTQRGLDSIFHQATRQNYHTAVVGPTWWLSWFGDDVHWASLESSWTSSHPLLRSMPLLPWRPVPKVLKRRLLLNGRYYPLREPWQRLLQRKRRLRQWGDDPKTKANEDGLRIGEAIKWLTREKAAWFTPIAAVDLMVLHLHTPASASGAHATHSWAYKEACGFVDQQLGKLVKALDLKRDTVLITADHGLSRARWGRGFGGWEPGASIVPLVMAGAGVKKAWMMSPDIPLTQKDAAQLARQRDIAPTISLLLGLPLPAYNMGRPLWQALKTPPSLREQRDKRRWRQQLRALRLAAIARGWRLPDWLDGTQTSQASWKQAFQWYQQREQKARMIERGKRLALGLLCWLLFATLLFVGAPPLPTYPWRVGVGVWFVFEGGFVVTCLLLFNQYSLSAMADSAVTLAGLFALALVCASVVLLAVWLGWGALGMGQWLSRTAWVCRIWLLLVALKSAIAYSLCGAGVVALMPHGLLHFGSIVAHLQTLALCLVVALWLFLDVLLYREGEPSSAPEAGRSTIACTAPTT